MLGVDLREEVERVLDRDCEEYRLIAEEEELLGDVELMLDREREEYSLSMEHVELLEMLGD